MDLRTIYGSYIETLNGRGYTQLGPFVQDGVIHNSSSPMSPNEYGQMVADSIENFPDFKFEVDLLTVESASPEGEGNGTVAAMLKLSYVPTAKEENAENRVVFYEHVFYKFEEGKISRVWSLVDLPKV